MTVTLYSWTDGSAPTLSGTAGDLINLLDKCLVDGYGAKSAAGWSKPYANSGNRGCYRMGTTGNTGFYLTVDDTGPGTNGAREARLCGWRTLTSLTAGTFPFPLRAQMNIAGPSGEAGSVIVRKSTTANATTRAWYVVADDSCFYLFIDAQDVTAPPALYGYFFGDIFSYSASDPYRCMIIGGTAEDATFPFANNILFGACPPGYMMMHKGVGGHFMAARETAFGSSVFCGKHWMSAIPMLTGYGGAVENAEMIFPAPNKRAWDSNSAHFGMGAMTSSAGGFPFPNGPDGNCVVSPVWVHHNGALRGYMKGLFVPLHDRAFAPLDSISGTGELSGKTFTNFHIVAGTVNATIGPAYAQGNVFVETSNTWS